MRGEPTCPRCVRPVHPPSLASSAWRCAAHGAVQPLHPPVTPSAGVLASVAAQARVPLWLPWPLPRGWLVTGVTAAGDERTGLTATALACSGPAPLGGMGEMIIVAEEPGVGLGARYAGLDAPDAGAPSAATPPGARLHAGGHPTALWWLDACPDRAACVGEALGRWLWLVLWPDSAGALLLENLELTDLREVPGEVDLLPLGALSPRLTG